jgi:aminomethyltransferase
MGQLIVTGANAASWLNRMLTNDVADLGVGQGQYTLLLNERGGVIDDLIAYRSGKAAFFLVVNASMIDEDFAWLERHLDDGVTLTNESDHWAGMAVQGPKAVEVFSKVFPDEILPPRNGIAAMADGGIVCRTGYTGEDGFEFFSPAGEGIAYWDRFVAAGAKPCALGSRDTLRLEMGYPLNGNDLSPDRSPIEAGLGFFCDLDKGDFMGRETLAQSDRMVARMRRNQSQRLIRRERSEVRVHHARGGWQLECGDRLTCLALQTIHQVGLRQRVGQREIGAHLLRHRCFTWESLEPQHDGKNHGA